ncbi:acetyl-CoA C-acetyltransferase [Enteractinococcus coprophilus]|uniref:Probable acetyl-CoA acetyltransferase n=1 Tax=Enteractinococcus coprophilus TaxID=1027633 RepID=A0A542ZZW4_9MICC|nr:acetyl-CoA C-acetyltransferase [Enteractinococcus coprophilus]TQL65878.1 acetyl-CoA C-acetyltransferase [Enteractinococcus coprophilus]
MSTPSPRDAVIVGGSRTPFGRLLGSLSSFSAIDLGAHAITGAIQDAGISADDVDTVIMGQVVQAGSGQNPGRQAALQAGLGRDVHGMTINKVCLSGATAVIDAARMIALGDANVVIAGGQESMTNAPHLIPGSRSGHKYGSVTMLDATDHDALTDQDSQVSMGILTEQGNVTHDLDRQSQDRVAAMSHQRAVDGAAVRAEEITPIEIPQRRGEPVIFDTDEGVREGTTEETLAKLPAAFAQDGSVTAGNSSQLSDGAAALVVVAREYAQKHGLNILATVAGYGQVAGPRDALLHSQPSNALLAAAKRSGWEISDVDFIEINEAFGAVIVQSLKDLDNYPIEQSNLYGGAIALGHPVGASGARLTLTAAKELDRRGGGRAAIALCGGGGQGEAILLER